MTQKTTMSLGGRGGSVVVCLFTSQRGRVMLLEMLSTSYSSVNYIRGLGPRALVVR